MAVVPQIVPVMMNVGAEPLGLLPVLLELGFVGLDLSFAGAGGFVCGQLLLVLLNLLLGCLQLLFVLLVVFGFFSEIPKRSEGSILDDEL